MLLTGEPGSGRTTFIKILQDQKQDKIDIIPITQASITVSNNWVLEAIMPWVTSDPTNTSSYISKIKSISEVQRPILVCADIPALPHNQNLLGSVTTALNLADSCNLRLSVLLCSSKEITSSLPEHPMTSARVVLDRVVPTLNDHEMEAFILSKITAADIPLDEVDQDTIRTIAYKASGIPGAAIRSLVEVIAGPTRNAPKTDSEAAQTRSPRSMPTTASIKTSQDTKKRHNINDLLRPRKT
jgi:type II secretory pathway predicted ATPase ExeA